MLSSISTTKLQIDDSVVLDHGQLLQTFVVDVLAQLHREPGRSVILRPFITEN